MRTDTVRNSSSALLDRATAAGPFSIPYGTVRVAAEPGLVVKVHSGLLWVPNHEEHCSVGLGAGEQMAVGQAGVLNVLASRVTQVEFLWPARQASSASAAH
jgi:hypothetical protein